MCKELGEMVEVRKQREAEVQKKWNYHLADLEQKEYSMQRERKKMNESQAEDGD